MQFATSRILVTIRTGIEKLLKSFKDNFHKCRRLLIRVQLSDTKHNELSKNYNRSTLSVLLKHDNISNLQCCTTLLKHDNKSNLQHCTTRQQTVPYL